MTAVLVSRPTTPLATSVVLLEGCSIDLDLTGFPVLDVPRAFAIDVLLVSMDRPHEQEPNVAETPEPVKALYSFTTCETARG